MEILFWSSAGVLGYIYLGYPLLLWLFKTRPPVPPVGGSDAVCLDVVIASHAEGPRLFKKIRDVYAQEGPFELRRVLVGLDGPDAALENLPPEFLAADFPLEIIREVDGAFPDAQDLPATGCVIIEFSERCGKPACLNRLMAYASADWTVFLDVRQRLDPVCFSALTARFSTPGLRVVSGNLEWEAASGASQTGEGVGIYWAYEKWIRRQESIRGRVPGATGACYALKRCVFADIPEDTLDDDVLIPLQACAAGGTCCFEETARIYDVPSGTPRQEALRKRRTIAGIYQLLGRHPVWNCPGGHPFWFHILSHKTLRLAGPFLLLAALGTNLALLGQCGYGLLFLGQGAFYGAALLSPWLRTIPVVGKVSRGIQAFVLLNGTCLVALWDSLTGRFGKGWDRAYTEPEAEA